MQNRIKRNLLRHPGTELVLLLVSTDTREDLNMSTNLSDMFERLGEEQDQLCARVAEKVSVYSECLNNLDKKNLIK